MANKDPLEIKLIHERAEKIVAEKVGFYRHLTIYIVINAIMLTINLVRSSEFLWFLIPLAGWGVLLIAHFISVFAFRGERFERWRRSEIEKELKKLGRED